MTARMPLVVVIYGLLGLIPFLAPPLVGVAAPDLAHLAARILAIYAALILSFLAGARWGMEVVNAEPSAWVVSLAMLPSLVGLAMLLVPVDQWRLLGLAVALALHWLWDIASGRLPRWYPWLRSVLSAGAVIGLIAGAVFLT